MKCLDNRNLETETNLTNPCNAFQEADLSHGVALLHQNHMQLMHLQLITGEEKASTNGKAIIEESVTVLLPWFLKRS